MNIYNPTKFKIKESVEHFDFIESNPFATVISATSDGPFISHLPVTPVLSDQQITIVGHLARANPHWKLLSSEPTTIVFHGAHSYISGSWYVEHDVPTWNYSILHAKGTIELIHDENGLIDCLKVLTNHAEKLWPSGWKFFIPEDLSGDILTKSIVGFKMKVTSIEFKKKLSQNRSVEDRKGVLKGLSLRSDEQSLKVLHDMKKLYSDDGSLKDKASS